jgi:hypothetical protein
MAVKYYAQIGFWLLKSLPSYSSSSDIEASVPMDYITGDEYVNTKDRPTLNSVQKIQPLKKSNKKSVPS